jgi:hypothetical protein
MGAKQIKLNNFGQNLTQIKEVARPIWIDFLTKNNLTPRQAAEVGWNLGVFVEELALDLRIKAGN